MERISHPVFLSVAVSLPELLTAHYLNELMSRHIACENRKVKNSTVLLGPSRKSGMDFFRQG